MRAIVVALLLAGASSAVFADTKEGEKKARLCLLCHKSSNTSTADPLLQAQPKEYLVVATTDYKTGKRPYPSMKADTAALSVRDIADISDYFAALPPLNGTQAFDAAKASAGEARVRELNCASCHGASFAGAKLSPRLAGQTTFYLVSQLQAFAARSREHPPVGQPFDKIGDLESIAHYFTSLK